MQLRQTQPAATQVPPGTRPPQSHEPPTLQFPSEVAVRALQSFQLRPLLPGESELWAALLGVSEAQSQREVPLAQASPRAYTHKSRLRVSQPVKEGVRVYINCQLPASRDVTERCIEPYRGL